MTLKLLTILPSLSQLLKVIFKKNPIISISEKEFSASSIEFMVCTYHFCIIKNFKRSQDLVPYRFLKTPK